MLEREVESEITKYAKRYGCIAIKLNGPNDRGKPDRAYFYQGRVLIIEMKAPGKKDNTTKLQDEWLRKFREQRFDATVVDRIGDGKTAIDRFIAKTNDEIELL